MTVNSEEDIRKLFAAGKVVRGAFERMKQAARAGVSTAELDALGGQYLKHHGARSAPQLYYDFPGATCISVNTEAAHGIPGQRLLLEGDMVNIDVSAELDGYVADMGESFVVGKGTPQQVQICYAVQAAVKAAIGKIRSGRSLNVIGKAVQKIADKFGYEIVQNLGSHGVGNSIHEEPSYVPLDNPSEKRRLDEGLVLTIEPFFSTGANWVEEQDDGWTLSVPEGDLVAQFEQTLIVTNRGALVVTA